MEQATGHPLQGQVGQASTSTQSTSTSQFFTPPTQFPHRGQAASAPTPPQGREGFSTPAQRPFSFEAFVNELNTPKQRSYYDKCMLLYPYNEDGLINGREVRQDNHRNDERLTVELLNAPLSVPIPSVDMVILYYKNLNGAELSRIKSFHGALVGTHRLKINFFRDEEGNYFFAKLYIPYETLYATSDFKFADVSQYTTLQRVYAIMKIINKTVCFPKYHTDDHPERFDYRRLVNDYIIAGSYVPHEPEVQEELLHSWSMIKNLFNPQPIEKIREYCGPQVAIYFAWSAYFNVFLLLASLFGLISYLGSLVITLGEYDYVIEEVCAGVYDYYPRCPLCATCNYTALSSSCPARRKLRRSSNIYFCLFTSFLVSGLLTSFKSYLSKLTASWEEPYTRLDVAVHHLSMTSQPRCAFNDSAAIEPIRIDYLMKYPKLKAIYDLAEKPSINFEEMTNVVLQHISPVELNNTEGPRSSGEAAFETVPLTPMQFQEVSQRMTGDDEFGFVMIPETRRNGGDNGEPVTDYHELDETFSQQVAKEQDEAIYQRHGAMSLCHFLVAWLMTILFIIYFVAIIALYGLFLGKIKPSQWFLQSIVNAFFNHFFRYVNGKVVYYLTLYQVPKYESQFNKWQAQKMLALFYTEYALFFYTASYAEFHFTNPGTLLNPPYDLKPCDEDDCHLALANQMGKVLTVDQLYFLFWEHGYPMMANKLWGCKFCETTIVEGWVGTTYWWNAFKNRFYYRTGKFFWSLYYGEVVREVLPPKKSFNLGDKQGNWYTDAKLVAYNTQPYMFTQNLIILKMLGYVALFGANWFMAPFVLYIVCLVYIRIHATHVLTNHRRPVPERAKSMGVWNKYIDSMVFISFLTTGFTFAFLSGVVPQTIHLLQKESLRYYMNTTLSFYETKNISSSGFVNAHTDRDYCIYNGNMEPPWAEEPFTLSSIGCFRLFYKLAFFLFYGGVFYGLCRYLRFCLVDFFDIFYDMTVSCSCSSALFQCFTRLLTPAPYVRRESTDGPSPSIQQARKDYVQRNLPQQVLYRAKKLFSKKGEEGEVILPMDELEPLSPRSPTPSRAEQSTDSFMTAPQSSYRDYEDNDSS